MPPSNGNVPRRRPTGVAVPAVAARARRPVAVEEEAPAKLIAIGGPATGSEFELTGDELVVGRSSDNPISIADTSVSRKHVLLRKTPTGWAASDMGSGNGTLINGQTISEETVLANGDTITLGDTELQFTDSAAAIEARPARAVSRRSAPSGAAEGGRPRTPLRSSRSRAAEHAAEASARQKKALIRIGGALTVVLAGVVCVKVYQNNAAVARGAVAAVREKRVASLSTLNQEGKNLVREGKWSEAKAKFEEVLAIDESFGKGSVQDYLKKASSEIPNQQALEEAEKEIAEGKVTAADAAFKKVSSDTLQLVRRDTVKANLELLIEKHLTDARALLGSPNDRVKLVQLKELAEDVLGAQPESRDALEFKRQANEGIDRIDHPPPPAKEIKMPWVEVQRLFRNGDPTGAFSYANQCSAEAPRCKALQAQISDYQDKYKKLESLEAGQLLALFELDRKIGDGQASTMAGNIGTRYGATVYAKASSARAKGDWGTAADLCRKVLAMKPSDTGCGGILSEAKENAKSVWLGCYTAKETDREQAIKLCRDVVQMTPKDDDYHRKAESLLQKLSSE
jgi:tetratricopeptide (TPR) repeat protein